MRLQLLFHLMIFLFTFVQISGQTVNIPDYKNPDKNFEERVDDLIARMTPEEKISQIMSLTPADLLRFGIPGFEWSGMSTHHVGQGDNCTVFPHTINQAATRDPELVREIGITVSDEARGLFNSHLPRMGLTFWMPVVELARDPRQGMTQECYGEDPLLTSQVTTALVMDIRGDDPRSLKAIATPKHFVANNNEWNAEIYPPEHMIIKDSTSGAKLIFVTTDTAADINLYFDWNCWFSDLSMMTFISTRTGRSELFGYIPRTGQLIRLNPRKDRHVASLAYVDLKTRDIYVRTGHSVYQWNVSILFSDDSATVEKVNVQERKIADAPEGSTFFSALSQSGDRRYLSATVLDTVKDQQSIIAINIRTGMITNLLTWKNATPFSHVQFSKYNPYLLRFAYSPHRIWIIDTRHPGTAKKIHLQEPGELVTHEDWWVNDQITFCGGYRVEESYVKITDIHTQTTRIIGAGAWWTWGTPYELSQFNWWHASGSPDGKWVATDNWHGHIAIIDERTSHLRLLTKNHRIYGGGEHPHVGWAPDSKSVEFTSHKLGNPDVVITYLPEKWNNPFMESFSSDPSDQPGNPDLR
ncbi:MAG: hypothetical protein GXO83_07150 [Chlorobi bacterium]|nr:hypothetical protein [Chlorobiota bacterium]